jgi:sporulation-control protein spo0M
MGRPMKGLHFARPFEYRLETAQENILQGQAIAGTLTVVNRDATGQGPLDLEIALAYGEFKEVKGSGAQAFSFSERLVLARSLRIGPGQSHQASWQFKLALDCPVTSRYGSLFLLYGGDLSTPGGWGRIDLPVGLAPPLQVLVALIENSFAFIEKGRRHTEGYTELKLKPPASYAALEELLLAVRLNAEGLALRFRGKVKGLARGAAGGVRSRWVDHERVLPLEQVLVKEGQPDRQLLRSTFEDAIREITPDQLLRK